MERFTISLEDALAKQFDELVEQCGYQNRSEAVRDLLRNKLTEVNLKTDKAPFCVASLSYVYDHGSRDLAERLILLQHEFHDVVVVTTHVHLDHDNCLETTLLRGATETVNRFAEAIMTERGVRHGKINVVPVSMENSSDHSEHGHAHASPSN